MSLMKSKLFMIEGGPALELVKAHIEEVLRVDREVIALAKELGVERVYRSHDDGTLLQVIFPGKTVPEGWTKPDKKGLSHPKKGTEWAKRFAAQKGHASVSQLIANTFEVPTWVEYTGIPGTANEGNWGSTCIGRPLNECGFGYMSKEGPYCLWVPDVAAEVTAIEARGYLAKAPAKGFKLEVPGLREIEDEEWDVLVAQHKLEKKRREKALSAEAAEPAAA